MGSQRVRRELVAEQQQLWLGFVTFTARAQVQSLVPELRSPKLWSVAKKNNKKYQKTNKQNEKVEAGLHIHSTVDTIHFENCDVLSSFSFLRC